MNSSVKPILFVVSSNNIKGDTGIPTGFNLSEVTHPLDKLEKAGLQVHIASPKGGPAPLDGLEDLVNDPVNVKYWNDAKFREKIAKTKKLADLSSADYSAIFFAGGHGTMWDFPNDVNIQKLIREIYESGKVVAAVCHGPAALVNATLSDNSYLVAGKKVAAFTNGEEEEVQSTHIVPFLLADELTAHGALHQNTPNWSNNVVVDGRLITGQNPQSAASLGEALAKKLLEQKN
jgi:putative intracellular protease/amidase